MSALAATAPLGHEFDAFLYAQAGEDQAGAPVSVLSVLARLDLDPWQEAARLAILAPAAAALKIASMLEALPGTSLTPTAKAGGPALLVAMLPHSIAVPTVLQRFSASGGEDAARQRASMLLVAIYLLFMVTQLFMMEIGPKHPPVHVAARPDSAPSQAVSLPSGKVNEGTLSRERGFDIP